MRYSKEQILELKMQGKSHGEISRMLGCCKATVTYHVIENYKDQIVEKNKKFRQKNPLARKVESFLASKNQIDRVLKKKLDHFTEKDKEKKITTKEFKDKIGDNPICYITGELIDLSEPSTYELDHIKPRAKGGLSTIDNCGLCTKKVNRAKNDMELDEFVELCKKVVTYAGYTIS